MIRKLVIRFLKWFYGEESELKHRLMASHSIHHKLRFDRKVKL